MTCQVDDILIQTLQRIFSNWNALRLGVENRAGGVQSRDKAEWIPSAFLEWIKTNDDLEKFEIEEFIVDVLNTEFDLIVDDGSLPSIVEKIFAAYKIHQTGDVEQLRNHCDQLNPIKEYFEVSLSSRDPNEVDLVSPQMSSEENDCQDKEAMPPKTAKVKETVVDEDGEVWEVVSSSKKRSGTKK